MARLRKLLCLLLLLLPFAGNATHIAGAELVYECVSPGTYNIKLKLYRDCDGGLAQFDDPITVFVFEHLSGNLAATIPINVPWQTPEIQPENWNACVGTPYNICVEEGVYETTLPLLPLTGGYNVGWARCCRNHSIVNLADPQCEGVTFLAHIPGPDHAACNNMPVFNETPSLFLCAGETYTFDYSATDPDGDSLVYEISNPYTGLDFPGQGAGNPSGVCGVQPPPAVDDMTNPMGPPPYRNVTYAQGHSYQNPFGPGGAISIDRNTGYMTAFPANLGVYVVAVSVKEYRNGVLLSENKRDFQFHVIACLPQGQPPTLTHNLGNLNVIGDTILAVAGQPFCYDFTVTDPNGPSSIVVTPLSVSFGGNGGFPPPYATITVSGTSPPVDGQICWAPACDYIGDPVPMIISARDTNDCPNYNIVFDTIWVRVLPAQGAPPVVTHDFGPINTVGDTIVLDVDENFCYNFFVVDTTGNANLQAVNELQDTSGNLLGQVHSVNTWTVGDTLFGEVCWNTFCNYGFTYMFVTRGTDEYQCPPNNVAYDTVFLRVLEPYNPPPTLTTDVSQNVLSGDTIIAQVHENFCFDFTVADTSLLAGESLTFGFSIRNLWNVPAPGEPATYSTFAIPDTLNGQICWTPRCSNNNTTYRIVVRGIQVNACNIQNLALDTVYVRVEEPYKPPPLISHDLGPNHPDNVNVNVADGESFCFDFELQDTVQPTFLVYEAEVFDLQGNLYNGAFPTPNLTLQTDSLIRGDLCWTVPCDLAGQSFMLVMTGRDTFDCRIANIVKDTIYIHHTENIPAPVDICVVSVESGDEAISIKWVPNTEPDGRRYLVFRKSDIDAGYFVHDSVTNFADSVYVDARNVDADNRRYCYQIFAVDRCNNLSPVSEEVCTVLLSGDVQGYDALLSWTDYLGWVNGVDGYELYQNLPISGQMNVLVNGFDAQTFFYTDEDASEARTCYRVRAMEVQPGCGVESWSNELCLNFPPTLYVPTAFTPNGDDLNDIFSSFGEFVEEFDMEIYDRWGKLIFHGTDQQKGWDGRINGQAASEGVYVFKIRVVGYDGQVLTRSGSVTLLR